MQTCKTPSTVGHNDENTQIPPITIAAQSVTHWAKAHLSRHSALSDPESWRCFSSIAITLPSNGICRAKPEISYSQAVVWDSNDRAHKEGKASVCVPLIEHFRELALYSITGITDAIVYFSRGDCTIGEFCEWILLREGHLESSNHYQHFLFRIRHWFQDNS